MPLELPRGPDRAMVAQGLDKFIHKVESLCGTESPPMTLVTHMLQKLLVLRPSATEVLQHFWLAPPLFGMGTPAPLKEAPLPSSGGPAQPTSEAAALKEPHLPLAKADPPRRPSRPALRWRRFFGGLPSRSLTQNSAT